MATETSGGAKAGTAASAAAAAATRAVRLPVVQHLRPLGSLENVFDEEKATEFVERVRRAADVATLGEKKSGTAGTEWFVSGAGGWVEVDRVTSGCCLLCFFSLPGWLSQSAKRPVRDRWPGGQPLLKPAHARLLYTGGGSNKKKEVCTMKYLLVQ